MVAVHCEAKLFAALARRLVHMGVVGVGAVRQKCVPPQVGRLAPIALFTGRLSTSVSRRSTRSRTSRFPNSGRERSGGEPSALTAFAEICLSSCHNCLGL
jgi:hypothetical protein